MDETVEANASETALAVNIGGGIKARLAGPLGVRIDYRLFKLRGSPINDQYHRFYAGATLEAEIAGLEAAEQSRFGRFAAFVQAGDGARYVPERVQVVPDRVNFL